MFPPPAGIKEINRSETGMNGNPFGCRDSAGPRGHSFGVTAEPDPLVTLEGPGQADCDWQAVSLCWGTQSEPVPNWPAACQLKGGYRAPGTGKSQSCGWEDKGDLILQLSSCSRNDSPWFGGSPHTPTFVFHFSLCQVSLHLNSL